VTPAKVKPTISPELLNQIDVRVGTIESVSDVANSEKLVAAHSASTSATTSARSWLGLSASGQIHGRSKASKRYSLSTFRHTKWQVEFRKACCLTSAMRTALPLCWRCRKRLCLTEPEQDDAYGRSAPTSQTRAMTMRPAVYADQQNPSALSAG